MTNWRRKVKFKYMYRYIFVPCTFYNLYKETKSDVCDVLVTILILIWLVENEEHPSFTSGMLPGQSFSYTGNLMRYPYRTYFCNIGCATCEWLPRPAVVHTGKELLSADKLRHMNLQ
jgi:hypothetical protein